MKKATATPAAGQEATPPPRFDFAEAFFSNTISIDRIIWLASLDERRTCPLRDALELGFEDIFAALGISVPEIDEDDVQHTAEILIERVSRTDKQGFLVQACTPVPMYADSNTYSWGHYTMRWFYTEALDWAFIQRVIEWKNAFWAKEQERLAKAKGKSRKKGGAK